MSNSSVAPTPWGSGSGTTFLNGYNPFSPNPSTKPAKETIAGIDSSVFPPGFLNIYGNMPAEDQRTFFKEIAPTYFAAWTKSQEDRRQDNLYQNILAKHDELLKQKTENEILAGIMTNPARIGLKKDELAASVMSAALMRPSTAPTVYMPQTNPVNSWTLAQIGGA